MKVIANKIGGNPLCLRENVAAERWDMDSEDIRFVGDICIECSFRRRANAAIWVEVSLRFFRNIRCSRCLEWNRVESQENFTLVYKDNEIKGSILEVDADIREKILLDWPLKPLCRPDCRGICPGCGRNLNTEQCICGSGARTFD